MFTRDPVETEHLKPQNKKKGNNQIREQGCESH